MMSFNMPMAETERSNAIELTLDNLIPNMQDALDDNAIVDVITRNNYNSLSLNKIIRYIHGNSNIEFRFVK